MAVPKFGIVTSIDHSAAVKAAGWDFVEELVQQYLQAAESDADWPGPRRLARAVLAVPASNALLPPELKVCGPGADPGRLRDYVATILRRAEQVGMKTIVFGSGAARTVPDGFDREKARWQIVGFVSVAADLAARHGVTIVAEPLNRGECNIINSVAEALGYVKELNHPSFQCLVDSYHMWLEDEPLENLRKAMPWIRHVHLADTEGRAPSGESGKHDYVSFFRVLKQAGYDRMIAVESPGFSTEAGIDSAGPRVLKFLKDAWDKA
jgi:sugar phosphate isomerase/epimerase